MLATTDSIINENKAMRGQIEFLKGYSSKWKGALAQKESHQDALNQLILTTYYLKEGLEDLYEHEDKLLLSEPGFSNADEIKLTHRAVMNTLEMIYRSLVNLNSKLPLPDKENISEAIDNLCQLITMLSVQENEVLGSKTS